MRENALESREKQQTPAVRHKNKKKIIQKSKQAERELKKKYCKIKENILFT